MKIPKQASELAMTFDDVLLKPCYSQIRPQETTLETYLTKNSPDCPGIKMNIPIISAAMDTVTESQTAIVMAQEGGIGIIHRNNTIEQQAQEVQRVKKFESGMIIDPLTVAPQTPLSVVFEICKENNISGLPVVDENKKLVGIITNRDLRFVTPKPTDTVQHFMTGPGVITAPKGTSLDQAKGILQKHRIEKLPLVDGENRLCGLITVRDIEKLSHFPLANKDAFGRLVVGAAIGVGTHGFDRAMALIAKNVDCIVLDTAHGHSKDVIELAKELKKRAPSTPLIVGNVATAKACEDLIAANVDAIKVGIGPGSICTTRIIAGIGVPQISALWECYSVCKAANMPMISDGGIKYSGDVVKALAAGASAVMIGSLFAGTDETPGETILYKGRAYKVYRGMGSLGAMSKGQSSDRYSQENIKEASKLVPEGIEGQVPHRGPLSTNIYQLTGGIRSGLGYVGAKNLNDLRENADFIMISNSSLLENHPHSIKITKEAPNYSL